MCNELNLYVVVKSVLTDCCAELLSKCLLLLQNAKREVNPKLSDLSDISYFL